ncbi:MAG: 23S rRNA (pseudouridine(1915)-N(3))-methyltransferase RlmH [bacterium]
MELTVLCVGKLKEKFYADACKEYVKRLGAYGKTTVVELPEVKKSQTASEKEIAACLDREADAILAAVPRGSALIALCVEGRELTSPAFSAALARLQNAKLTFVIGSSDGLSPRVKEAAALRLSMSQMTFPHHLARVMLLEQLYRALNLAAGGKYHK